ncbi:MAG: hypothetical protein IJL30_06565 [Clostridia bacterium]|nr:hypothetical protein [Clostridia bacterium]
MFNILLPKANITHEVRILFRKTENIVKKAGRRMLFLWDSSPAGEPFRGSDSPPAVIQTPIHFESHADFID